MNKLKHSRITFRIKDHLKLMKKISFNGFFLSKCKTNFNDSYYDFVSAISLNKNTFFVVAVQDDDIYSDSQVELSIVKKIGMRELYSPNLINSRDLLEKILTEEIYEVDYKKFMSLFKEGKGDLCQYNISTLLEKLSHKDYFGFDLSSLIKNEKELFEALYLKIFDKINGVDFIEEYQKTVFEFEEKLLKNNSNLEIEKIQNIIKEKTNQKNELEKEINQLKNQLANLNKRSNIGSVKNTLKNEEFSLFKALSLCLIMKNGNNKHYISCFSEDFNFNERIYAFRRLKLSDL